MDELSLESLVGLIAYMYDVATDDYNEEYDIDLIEVQHTAKL